MTEERITKSHLFWCRFAAWFTYLMVASALVMFVIVEIVHQTNQLAVFTGSFITAIATYYFTQELRKAKAIYNKQSKEVAS